MQTGYIYKYSEESPLFSYTQEDGSIAICSKQSSVPTGATWAEVTNVPDRAYRNAWKLNGSVVEIDPVKKTGIDKALIMAEAQRRITLELDGEREAKVQRASSTKRTNIDAIDAKADAAILAGKSIDEVVW